MAITQKVFLNAEKLFKQLAQIQMKDGRLEHYFDAVFPRSDAQKKKRETPARWKLLQEVFETAEDLQLPGVQGTLWGAYNAITRFEDYKQPQQEEQPGRRLERTWFGGSADTKLKALTQAAELAGSWN